MCCKQFSKNIKKVHVSVRRKENHTFQESVENILKKITEHKEAFTIIGVLVSFIVTTVWNLGCDFGYMGYAERFNIPMMYIKKDYSSLLVQFIIILTFTFLVILPIFRLAQYNYYKKIKRNIITFGISLFIIILPLIVSVLVDYIDLGIAESVLLIASVLLSCLSILFLFLYVTVLLIFPFNKISKQVLDNSAKSSQPKIKKKRNCNKCLSSKNIPQQKKNTNDKKVKDIIKRLPVAMVGLVLICFLILIGVYFMGMVFADSKTDYRFLVDDINVEMFTDNVYQVILSETDTHYYLSESCIESANGEKNVLLSKCGQLKLNIDTHYVTVLEKSEKNFVLEIDFAKVEID